MSLRRGLAFFLAAFLAVAGALHVHPGVPWNDPPCAACTVRAASDVAAAPEGVRLPAGHGFALTLPGPTILESRAIEGILFETGPPAIG